MNDDLMFDYLLQMGAMRPEQEELKRKQAMIDALRGRAMEPMQGQMVGKHYVAPNLANAIAQMGTAYMAGQQQKGVDAGMAGFNERQRAALQNLRNQRAQNNPAASYSADYSAAAAQDNNREVDLLRRRKPVGMTDYYVDPKWAALGVSIE